MIGNKDEHKMMGMCGAIGGESVVMTVNLHASVNVCRLYADSYL